MHTTGLPAHRRIYRHCNRREHFAPVERCPQIQQTVSWEDQRLCQTQSHMKLMLLPSLIVRAEECGGGGGRGVRGRNMVLLKWVFIN